MAVLSLTPFGAAQAPDQPLPHPDLGPVARAVDGLAGQEVVPALANVYSLLGQNLTREDLRISADINFTKAEMGVMGLLVGAGKAEVQADVHARFELHVISSERVRRMLEGAAGYNLTASNSTFLQGTYLPAEVFRLSLSAEALAAFQKAEEAALSDYLAGALPELQVLGLQLRWSHTQPFEALTDSSLSEPPVTLDLDLVVQYIHIDSIPGLLHAYLESKADPAKRGKDAYVDRLKHSSGDSLARRDFFAAAAYTQLLNLSVQPGWSLDLRLHVPNGYEFTYLNGAAKQESSQAARLHLDGQSANHEVQSASLASLTQPRAVVLLLFGALWGAAGLLAFPFRAAYGHWRVPRFAVAAGGREDDDRASASNRT